MTQTENMRNFEGTLAGTPEYDILRSRFAYRIKDAKVQVNGYGRLQEMLEQEGEFGYAPLANAMEEKLVNGVYVVTNTSREKGPDAFLLQVGRIDVLYPHQEAATDAGQANTAKEYLEPVRVEFRMAGLKNLVTGNILVPRGDESESKIDKIVRIGKALKPKESQKKGEKQYRFLAFTDVECEDLAQKLGLKQNYMKTIIVPQAKLPEIYLA